MQGPWQASYVSKYFRSPEMIMNQQTSEGRMYTLEVTVDTPSAAVL